MNDLPNSEEQVPQCDVNDIVCQMQMLGHLQGMEKLMGSSKTFQEKYPDFADLIGVTRERIAEQEATLRDSFTRCNLPIPDELQIKTQEMLQNDETNQE